MSIVKRTQTYRLYPSKTQQKRLDEMLKLHRDLYNAALEQRIFAYKHRQLSLSYQQQAKDLTDLRAHDPAYSSLNAQSEQATLKRLDKSYKNFFRRVKQNEQKKGFPRFKSANRFKSFGYPSHGDGWKFQPKKNFVNGTVHLSSVGKLQARGRSRFQDQKRTNRNPGQPKTLQVMKKGEHWYASIVFETKSPYRASGEEAIAFDWGTKTFLTLVNEQKQSQIIENPRNLKKSSHLLKKAQRKLSRKKRGSSNREKAKKKVIRIHKRVANQRENFLHQQSASLVKRAKGLGSEELSVKGMTVFGGSYKAGLNKAILDTAPATFLSWVEYKAEEAGIPFFLANTKKLKPTQTCSGCGHQEKKTLSERIHHCKKCGLILDRDVNAALVLLHFLLNALKTGREPALGVEKRLPLQRITKLQL